MLSNHNKSVFLSNYGMGLQGFRVSSCSSHGGGVQHGLGSTKVGAWMPRTVGVVRSSLGRASPSRRPAHASQSIKDVVGISVKKETVKKQVSPECFCTVDQPTNPYIEGLPRV